MSNVFHHESLGHNNHPITANPDAAGTSYADIAARDADSGFHGVVENLNKVVRVESPLSFYILTSNAPAWLELSNTTNDQWAELSDTPGAISAGLVVQGNAGGTALEFGQALRATDSPTFDALTLTGDLTVQGITTTLDTTTLLVEDKNIELGNVAVPTDVTADGGGITLKGATDKTIIWLDATDAWTFNQDIELNGQIKITGGGPAVGKVLTSDAVGLANWTLPAGGGWTDSGTNVFLTSVIDRVGIGEAGPDTKLHVADGGTAGAVTPLAGTIATFESPGDGYISILTPDANKRGILFGEPSSNVAGGLIFNNGGNAGFDFQFGGVTKAAFTSAGHLHLLTDTDQKHNFKIKTANNANDSGIAWENSGGNFSQTIFRTDVGSNRSDLIFAIGSNADIDLLTNSFKVHGSAANEGRLEVLGALQISSGSPALDKVLTSDATGLATWQTPSPTAGGWTDDGTVVRLTAATDKVGIGTASPNATLEVNGTPGASVGGFASGALHVTSPATTEFSNAVITGHSSFATNTQLWYLGSTSSSNNNIALINRQNAELHLHTNNLNRFTIQAGGNVGIGETNPTEKLEVNGNLKVATVVDTTIYAQLNSSVDQVPGDTNPTVITYNTQDAIAGLTHSTTVNPGEITIDTAGIYFVSPQPQVGKDTGAAKTDFDMFLQVDSGGGFADEANSNIKLTIKDSDITDVIVSAFTIQLAVGDKIRMMQRVSSSTVGLGLKNTDAEVGPPTIPRTPAIIFTMYRVGGI